MAMDSSLYRTDLQSRSFPRWRTVPAATGTAPHQCSGTFNTDGAFAGELKLTVPPNWLMPA